MSSLPHWITLVMYAIMFLTCVGGLLFLAACIWACIRAFREATK